MAKVTVSTELDVPADELWRLVGQFNGLPDWHPAVEKSELEEEGQIRKLSLAGGGTIVERLERIDDNERVYTYTIEQGPLPVANYVSTIRVRQEPDGKRSVVEWSGEFQAAGASETDAMKVIQDVYQAGIDNLKKLYGSS